MNKLEFLPFTAIAAKFKRCMNYSVINPNHPSRSFSLFLNMEDLSDCTFYIGLVVDEKRNKTKNHQELEGTNRIKEHDYILDVMKNLLKSKHIADIDIIYDLKSIDESHSLKSGLLRSTSIPNPIVD